MVVAKIRRGGNFKGVLKYLLSLDKGARILGGRAIYETVGELSREFEQIAALRPTTQKPVRHFAIAFSPEDGEIDDVTKLDVAERFLALMGNQPPEDDPDQKGNCGYYNNQYLVVDHARYDPSHPQEHAHDHIHIIANAITFSGERIPDSFDALWAKKACRQIEQEFGFAQVSNDSQTIVSPPSHEQRIKREQSLFEQGKKDAPPEPYYKTELQAIINAASEDQPELPSFFNRLIQAGVTPNAYLTDKGRKRISYAYKGVNFRGSKLKDASFPKLIKNRGINYDPDRDQETMERAARGELSPKPKVQPEPASSSTEKIRQAQKAIDIILGFSQSSPQSSTPILEDTQQFIDRHSQGKPKVSEFFINLARDGVIPHLVQEENGKKALYYRNTRFFNEEEIVGDDLDRGHFIDLIRERELENDLKDHPEVQQCALAGDFSNLLRALDSASLQEESHLDEIDSVEEMDRKFQPQEATHQETATDFDQAEEKRRQEQFQQEEVARQRLATVLAELARTKKGNYLFNSSQVTWSQGQLTVTEQGEELKFQAQKEEEEWKITVDQYDDIEFKQALATWAEQETVALKRKQQKQLQKKRKQNQMEL
jgi:hypothetical protein